MNMLNKNKKNNRLKLPHRKFPKPAVEFDRDKNQTYIPQDESIDPLEVISAAPDMGLENPNKEVDVEVENLTRFNK